MINQACPSVGCKLGLATFYMDEHQIARELKEKIDEINQLLKQSNDMKIKVDLKVLVDVATKYKILKYSIYKITDFYSFDPDRSDENQI